MVSEISQWVFHNSQYTQNSYAQNKVQLIYNSGKGELCFRNQHITVTIGIDVLNFFLAFEPEHVISDNWTLNYYGPTQKYAYYNKYQIYLVFFYLEDNILTVCVDYSEINAMHLEVPIEIVEKVLRNEQ